MYVVMVAAECAPAAKAGGLGDVVSGLSRELEIRGNAVEIILPKYASLRHSEIWGLAPSYQDLWNPETDPLIPVRYSARDPDAKAGAKQALRDRFWLRQAAGPLVAYVGRLDEQKGMHLVNRALFYTLGRGGQFVLMGDAHYHDGINDHFGHLVGHLNDNPDCHLELGYREELAHLIYAGADLLVVPSMFEPCGLAPLIAMRYGTVPVVRATGGMIDTVSDRDHSGHRPAERNGYVFHHTDNQAIESALSRALALWSGRPRQFRELAANGMRADYSWARPGAEYLAIYQSIRQGAG